MRKSGVLTEVEGYVLPKVQGWRLLLAPVQGV